MQSAERSACAPAFYVGEMLLVQNTMGSQAVTQPRKRKNRMGEQSESTIKSSTRLNERISVAYIHLGVVLAGFAWCVVIT